MIFAPIISYQRMAAGAKQAQVTKAVVIITTIVTV
jgi:hypothetical protein